MTQPLYNARETIGNKKKITPFAVLIILSSKAEEIMRILTAGV